MPPDDRTAHLSHIAKALLIAVSLGLFVGGSTWGFRSPFTAGSTPTTSSPATTPTTSLPATTPTTTAVVVPTPTRERPKISLYGSAISADDLANTQIGGGNYSPNARTSFRFRAGTSAPLVAIGVYLEDGPGYSGGDGGALEISVQTDDDSADHRPSGEILARMSFEPRNPIGQRIGERTFAQPPTLQSGQLYHLVFRNTARSPGQDFVSINALFARTPGQDPQRQPRYDDDDWALLLDADEGWRLRDAYTPILQLRYGNGVVEGVGYIEVWSSEPGRITGNSKVREVFTVSGPSRKVSSVAVRVERLEGSSPLSIRLEDEDGNLLDGGSIAASSMDGGPAWVTVRFATTIVLESAALYSLELSTASETVYEMVPIRKGTQYDFQTPTFFGDGYGQFTTGDDWRGFDQPSVASNSREGDLQFYFTSTD